MSEALTQAQFRVLNLVRDRDMQLGWLTTYGDIASELGMPTRSAKLHARRLERAGLLYRSAAFDEDTGMLVGSGLGITTTGRIAIKATEQLHEAA